MSQRPNSKSRAGRAQQSVLDKYSETQVKQLDEKDVEQTALTDLQFNWTDDQIPDLQRQVVEVQLQNLRNGIVDPVFATLATCLRHIELPSYSLLDSACATGYYNEVVAWADQRDVQYHGCDYSAAMIESARQLYPQCQFEVQDLTELSFADQAYDVVLVSGVLEHVPRFTDAVAQACRVAGQYLIVHRCPLQNHNEHQFTVGSQYTIETPRIYFSRQQFLELIQQHGFELVAEVPLSSKLQHLWRQIKHRLRSLLPSKTTKTSRYQSSLVFQRTDRAAVRDRAA